MPFFLRAPYIFPGVKDGQHLVNIDKQWRKIRKQAGLEDVRLHDLRRTVGSWLACEGYSLPENRFQNCSKVIIRQAGWTNARYMDEVVSYRTTNLRNF
jgi:integrase